MLCKTLSNRSSLHLTVHYWSKIAIDIKWLTRKCQKSHFSFFCPLFAFLGIFSWLFWVHWFFFFCAMEQEDTRRCSFSYIFIELDQNVLEKLLSNFLGNLWHVVMIIEHVDGNFMMFWSKNLKLIKLSAIFMDLG